MFAFKRPTDDPALLKAITLALEELATLEVESPEYKQAVENIVKLNAMKLPTKETRKRVSPDAVIAAAANVGGILLILNFEKLGNVTSKALGFVAKAKL